MPERRSGSLVDIGGTSQDYVLHVNQCSTRRLPAFYTAGMSEDTRLGEDEPQHEELPALPRHLSALIGSLRGPADLGRNHDKYLTYADREEPAGLRQRDLVRYGAAGRRVQHS